MNWMGEVLPCFTGESNDALNDSLSARSDIEEPVAFRIARSDYPIGSVCLFRRALSLPGLIL